MIPPDLSLQLLVEAVQSGMEWVEEEVSKLLPQGLQVEVFRVPCLGRMRMRLAVESVMQIDKSAWCYM
jgi:hypothetical protein